MPLGPTPRSRRRALRLKRKRSAKQWVNALFGLFTFFELGCPRDWKAAEASLGPPRRSQWGCELAVALLQEIMAFGRFDAALLCCA
eukprot:1589378-Alexandrium_andersonii.AAC.1